MKWILPEVDHDAAVALYEDAMQAGHRLTAPPVLLGEVSSAVYKLRQRGAIDMEEAIGSLEDFGRLAIDSLAPRTLSIRAVQIAAQYELKWVYDAFYVALADIMGCDLWTADAPLHRKVRVEHPNVQLLSDYRGDDKR